MRMKKILFIAAVALAAAACSKTIDTNPAASQKAIGFGSWNDALTKARATASDHTAFANGDAFDVFGYKTVASGNSVVFNGDDVTATVSGSDVSWDYTTKRYWDMAASKYVFYAVLPAGNLKNETTSDYALDGLFSGSYTFGTPSAMSNDIMVASEKEVLNTAFKTDVQISFNHVATCVDLKVKQDKKMGDNVVVKVTALSLEGIKNTGDFEVSAYNPAPTVAWSNQAGTEDYTVTIPAGGIAAVAQTAYSGNAAQTTTGDPGTLFSGYVFMPQTLVDQKLKISYTIQVGTEAPIAYTDVEVVLKTFQSTDTDNNSGANITVWAPKTHYIYYLTIGADNAITFTASVNEWASTNINGYHYILE